jgi:hypothetical protein
MDTLILRLELDQLLTSVGSKESRANGVFQHLVKNPKAQINGRPLARLVVESAVELALSNEYHLKRGVFDALFRALERDGFVVEGGRLRPALPGNLDLPAADDEVHLILSRYGLMTSLGHLDQAITAHAQGNWAAANAQLRTFCESLFDEIVPLLDPKNGSAIRTGEPRRQYLANLVPPFISRDLNEWSDDGKNFVNGIFKRLHPQGSHPGLSDEQDCTFRLHLVLLVAHLFLRRLDSVLTRKP